MYKLLALDIDGTLVGKEEKMSDRVKETILKVKQMGVHVALLSGRNYLGMKPYIEQLGLDTIAASANGTVLVDVNTDEIVYQEIFDKEVAKKISLEAKKKGLLVVNMSEYTIYTEDFCHAPKEVRNFMHFNFNITKDIIKCIEEKKPNKISLAGESIELNKFRKEYLNQFKEKFNIDFGMEYFLEIYSKKASKGKALKIITQNLGCKKEQVICIGDSENDIEMFKSSGCAIAMGSATDAVKKYAHYITENVDKDGAAYAIEKFILKDQGESTHV
ncbi:MAG: Cof-type HAD-IIB family hydrolase [Eubacteriaceae bacterium]